MQVCVLASGGKPLMPTNFKRARKLLRKGRRVIRTCRYDYRSGDTVWTNTGKHTVKGVHNCGKSILFADGGSCLPATVKRHVYVCTGGWTRIE